MSKKTLLCWNQIDWDIVKQRVFRLQRRIFRATSNQKLGLIYYLQNKLINSFDAKLLAVYKATDGEKTTKGEHTNEYKIKLAYQLKLNPNVNCNNVDTIEGVSQQYLIQLALSPQWEAILPPNIYGFRPGYNPHDAVEQIRQQLTNEPQYVVKGNLELLNSQQVNSVILKRIHAIPLIKSYIQQLLQLNRLEATVMQLNKLEFWEKKLKKNWILEPILINILFYEIHNNLKKSFFQFLNQSSLTSISFVSYQPYFLILCPNLEMAKLIQSDFKNWLANSGIDIQNSIHITTQGFLFLGFQFILIRNKNQYFLKRHISKKSKQSFIQKTRLIIQQNKAVSAYVLIKKLTPVIIHWVDYFQYCDCKKDFQVLDHVLFSQLRAWVFRRKAQGKNRHFLKQKYFPSGKTFIYKKKKYQNNWVLCGEKKDSNDQFRPVIKRNFLPKLSWTSSKRFIPVKPNYSIYNDEHIYWTLRWNEYPYFQRFIRNLIFQQNGKCGSCHGPFSSQDKMTITYLPINQVYRYKAVAVHKKCVFENSKKSD